MLFSNISIWELNCYKWEGRQGENLWQNTVYFIFTSTKGLLLKVFEQERHIWAIPHYGHYIQRAIFWKKTFSYMLLFKVPVASKFLFSYVIVYITQWTSVKTKIDLDKMQSLLEVSKTFKFAAILVHHSHQSSLVWNELWRRYVTSGLTYLACFTSVNLT